MSYHVELGKSEDGSLSFSSTNKGKIINISKETRAHAINLLEITRHKEPVFKSLYIVRHSAIIPLARVEDKDIDALYISRDGISTIILAPNATATWDGNTVSFK